MPHEFTLLQDLLVLLIASIPIAFICNRLRLPLIVGFMITGVLIGPFALGLIKDVGAVETLAEIGVVLLLFTIGLEFSLRRIIEMKRLVLYGGGLQVLLTVLFVTGIAYWTGQDFNRAIFFGFLFALSSTAIVLKTYMERAEVDTPHGRSAIGILLFQDLCIVPMMLMVPILSGKQGSSVANVLITLGTALAAVAVIIFMARFLVPRALYHIVRLRSPEVFVIFVVLVSLGMSWLTAQFGLSLALGAFIAGLVLSESEYSHQIVADILPFRDVFNGVFFISIGMLLSAGFLFSNLPSVLSWVGVMLVIKAVTVLLIVRLLGYPLRISAMTALGLAQIGEFSFILAKAGLGQGLLAESDYQKFLAAAIISMVLTPFLIKAAPRIGYAIQAVLSPDSLLEPTMAGLETNADMKEHVVIVGYGLNGRNVSRVLRKVKVAYMVLELNADVVSEAAERGEPIQYGDSSRREVLHRARLEDARVLVIAISDPIATRRTLALAREMNPDIHIIVRTRYMTEVSDLYNLRADEVIPEEFETSIEIFSRVLRQYRIPRNIVQREVERIRHEGYEILRLPSSPHIELSDIADALAATATETLFIRSDSPVVGKSLAKLDLRKRTGATIIAAIREGGTQINPGPDFKFAPNDIIALHGSPEEIEKAMEYMDSFEEGGWRRARPSSTV